MHPSSRLSLATSRNLPSARGFTMVELLIGITLGGIAVAAAASVMVSHMNSTNATMWAVQLQRDLSKFNFLVNSEANEACRLQSGTPPANDTVCTPGTVAVPVSCATVTGPATNFNLLVPMDVANNDPEERVITYSFNAGTGQVLRSGPRILSNGRLDATVANNQTGSVVLDGVTAFTPTVSNDCRSATIVLTLSVPTTTATFPPQTIRVAAGAEQFIR
ncbi:prepilin-type N-terminal cleavage/methylation domain-containing protein [Synechococcus sp. CS-1332]|uniref:prepilin-type N-terminal cleavage/methylation domain-containing protein n=1 Tax=Synechococcus sp. CS-1332 TaxID=2847972 RepID=UPI00223BE302|nr:prepilin-type N-terminal cleavage/methylation domain-containing protein [Synechococcus sp. CS-1332]MCT0207752.1 prepilin-type N-terminal cleavage/methylation domain-containing protein [Synechococcus sp. CS-1332]